MGESAAEIDDLVAAVEEAFASVPRGAVTLHEAEVMDSYGTEGERRVARERDREQDWRDVPAASIEACPDALPFLDPVSWRYYLPAFIRCGLRRMTDRRSSIVDRAIYALDLGEDPSLAEVALERFRTLNAVQVRVVRRFLELASRNEAHCDDEVAQRALERYWSAATGA